MARKLGLWIKPSNQGVYIGEPYISVTSSSSDTTPNFSVAFGHNTSPDDVLRIQYRIVPNSWATYVTRILTQSDINGPTGSIGEAPILGDATYEFRMRIESGSNFSGWSNVVQHTVDAVSATSLVASTGSYTIAGTVATLTYSNSSAWFSADLSGGDTGDLTVAGFNSETDASSKLAIASNAITMSCDTENTTAYAVISGISAPEVTLKGRIKFSHATSVAGSVKRLDIARFFDASNNILGWGQIYGDTSGNISNYSPVRGNFTESGSSSNFTSPSLATDTWYDFYIYYRRDATVGGITFKIGTWAETSTGLNDNTDTADVSYIRFGAPTQQWGAGTNDCTVSYDSIEVWKSDAR